MSLERIVLHDPRHDDIVGMRVAGAQSCANTLTIDELIQRRIFHPAHRSVPFRRYVMGTSVLTQRPARLDQSRFTQLNGIGNDLQLPKRLLQEVCLLR